MFADYSPRTRRVKDSEKSPSADMIIDAMSRPGIDSNTMLGGPDACTSADYCIIFPPLSPLASDSQASAPPSGEIPRPHACAPNSLFVWWPFVIITCVIMSGHFGPAPK